ncbi:Na+/H+ antiporter [Methylovirgula sp. 4M-Z18]|uniref:Na+/H+ antiporter n=1 Tax=Methylovirgula sp. 4M-Z18 TaxID=2293567 RepID=UPI000E2F8700|nr:Na+/H+ antiporter [Methylovirgula sp. 4M-Z18]RFB81582.1 Na+/H+ antiporter [Methylovirgula sp. 4M-Z18]
MSPAKAFQTILLLMMIAVVLDAVARRLRLPSASVLVLAGIVLAFVPGLPDVEFDPDFVMVLFLPPLLLSGAYFTVWPDFRANLRIILQLAVGAVVVTTLLVGVVTHFFFPALPWAACFALGAIISPPDAVAARAVLDHLNVPPRIAVLLEGESLINDASGLVLFRFAVAAALTGTFSAGAAAGSFVYVSVVGVGIGLALGWICASVAGRLTDARLTVVWTFLSAWAAYLLADSLHLSGVLATVACGLVLGRLQHQAMNAAARVQARAVWSVVTFVMEALVFVLVGLALRGVLHRFAADWGTLLSLLPMAAAIFAVLVLARFAWIFPTAYIPRALIPSLRARDPYPPAAVPLVMSWAGMRGVVSLAAALSLPDQFPGRDIILFVTFCVVAATIVALGLTLGPVARTLAGKEFLLRGVETLSEEAVRVEIARAEFDAIRMHSLGANGEHAHPRLVEQYGHRLSAAEEHALAKESHGERRLQHYRAVLIAVEAGRRKLLELFNSGRIHDSVMHRLEAELDREELFAARVVEVTESA